MTARLMLVSTHILCLAVSGCWADHRIGGSAFVGGEAPSADAAQRPHAERLLRVKDRLLGGPVLFADDFDRAVLGHGWIVEEGAWQTGRQRGDRIDGVVGRNGSAYPDSFLWTRDTFAGDIVVEFDAQCLSEPVNDINVVICGQSPNYPPPEVPLYLFGIGGWDNTRTGVERAPDYRWKALTGGLTIRSDRVYHVLAARVGSTFYLFVDDRLIVEAKDPNPLPARGQVAFHVYNSTVRFQRLRIRQPSGS